MTITVNLPKKLTKNLQRRASFEKVSLDQLIANILTRTLETEMEEDFPTPEEWASEIEAMGADSKNVRPPQTDSLAEDLKNAPADPHFDLKTWSRRWTAVESDIKATTQSNTISEGRG